MRSSRAHNSKKKIRKRFYDPLLDPLLDRFIIVWYCDLFASVVLKANKRLISVGTGHPIRYPNVITYN